MKIIDGLLLKFGNGGLNLDKAQQTITKSSISEINVMGNVFFKIGNHLICPIALSTWICMLATFLIYSTLLLAIRSCREIGVVFLVNTGGASNNYS